MENNINFAAMPLNDIIFLNRNKAYGAYDLRRSYNQNIKRALLFTLLTTTAALGYQYVFAHMHLLAETKEKQIVIDMAKVDPAKITTPPPPKPQIEKPKGTANAATVAAAGEKKPVSDNTQTIDTIAQPDPDIAIANETKAGTKGEAPGVENGTALMPETPAPAPPAPSEPVNWAEVMPEYPGGEKALMRFIGDNLRYPEYEATTGIQGKAFVGFIVDENGKVTDIKIARGVSRGIDREAMRVIGMLHTFTPGSQSGRKVKVRYVVPINFHLKEE